MSIDVRSKFRNEKYKRATMVGGGRDDLISRREGENNIISGADNKYIYYIRRRPVVFI